MQSTRSRASLCLIAGALFINAPAFALAAEMAYGAPAAAAPSLSAKYRLTMPALDHIATQKAAEEAIAADLRLRRTFRDLSEDECRSLAAAASTNGTLLDLELALLDDDTGRKKHCLHFRNRRDDEKKRLKRDILMSAATTARNASIAEALKTFYSLAVAESRRDLLTQSLEQIDAIIAEVDRLKGLGLAVPSSPEELRQKRSGLLTDGVALNTAAKKFNQQLAFQLNTDLPADSQFWPLVDWNIHVAPIDVEHAVTIGLDHHSELRFLDRLASGLNAETLKTIEAVMPILQPLLTLASSDSKSRLGMLLALICPPRPDEETLDIRRTQVLYYRNRRAQEIRAQILEAVYDLEAAGRRLSFAKDQMQNAEKSVHELEQKRRSKLVTEMAVSTARMELLRRMDEVIQFAAQWHLARMQLEHAQGTLGRFAGQSVEAAP